MEIFRLFGTISINKAKAIADLKAVEVAGRTHGTKLQSVLTKIGRVAKTVFAGVAVAAGAIFTSAIKKAADFELAMAKVRAITGAMEEEFAALTEKAKQLGLETAQTMTDIAAGMEAFGRAGFSATEIIEAMDGAVALAESQVMDLGEAVGITANILNGMRLEASESERVVNALAAAASSSDTTVESLAQSMKYFAPIAADLNIPLEDALGLIGKLGDAGVKGTMATRALSTAFSRLAKPTDEMKEVMRELNLEFFDAEGNFIGATEMIGLLEDRFAGLTQEQRQAAISTLFGAEAMKHFSILIAEGQSDLEAYIDSITDTQTAFEQQQEMLDTVSGQWTILKGSIELLLVTIGQQALPAIQTFINETLVPWVNHMTTSAEGTSVFEEAINKLIAPFKWMIEHGEAMKTALLAVGAGLAVVVAYTNPLLALTAAIGGLILLFTADDGLPSTVEGMRDFNSELDEMIDGLAEASKSKIVGFIGDYYKALTDTITTMKKAGDVSKEAYGKIIRALMDLQDEVLRMKPEDMAEAWVVGVDMILAEFAEMHPELEKLRQGFIGLGGAIGSGVDPMQMHKDALAEAKRVLDEWRASQEDATDTTGDNTDGTNDNTEAVSELVKEYNELIAALNATEEGTYEYAIVAQELGAYHDKLVTAAEYLVSKNKEVGQVLKSLIALTAQYARVTDDATEAKEDLVEFQAEHIRTMDDLIEEYREFAQILRGTAIGSVEYADALQGVQSQYDELMNIVDFLQAREVAVSQAIWDQIDALVEQGAVTRRTAKEQERYDDSIERGREVLEEYNREQEEAKRQAEEFRQKVKRLARELWDLAVKSIQKVVKGYQDMKQEAEDYRQALQEIHDQYAEDELSAEERKNEDIEDEGTRHKRKLEDIEKDYQREMADFHQREFDEAEDYAAALNKIETDHNQDLEDERTRHGRALEDIDTDYTRSLEDAVEDRDQALTDEKENYEETKTTIHDILVDIKDDVLTYLGDKALDIAFTAIVDSFLGIETASGGAATGVEGAVARMAASLSTNAPGIIGWLGKIALAFVPLWIGLSDSAAGLVANINKWITENILGQQYGSGLQKLDTETGEWIPVESAAEGKLFTAPAITTIAEKEPEMAIPLSKMPMLAAAGAGAGEVHYNIYLDNVRMDTTQRVRELAESIEYLRKSRLRGAEGRRE